MSDQNQTIMGAEQAALHLGLSKSTLAKMRLNGSGPDYVKLGRRVGYVQDDLDKWVMSHKFRSTSEYPSSDVNFCSQFED